MKKKLILILTIFIVFLLYLFIPKEAFGVPIPICPSPPGPGPCPPQALNPLGGIRPPAGIPSDVTALGGFIRAIISLLVIGAGVAAFVLLIVSGIQYMTAGGDPKNTQAARGRLTAAIIGLAIVLASFAIIRFIEFVFRVKILQFTLPTF